MPSREELAWSMRRNMTPAEGLLWSRLRANQLGGLHFRRQHIVAGFIADFYCHAARLVVEVDGLVHERLAASDEVRNTVLESAGFRVMHVTNLEVVQDIETVLERILNAVRRRIP
jgi:very-short-patch-repair endonuclease